MNSIPVPRDSKIKIYANDTALISSIKNYDIETFVKRMALGLIDIESEFPHGKFDSTRKKTESILFTKSEGGYGRVKNDEKQRPSREEVEPLHTNGMRLIFQTSP
jgi:hypothetical protein